MMDVEVELSNQKKFNIPKFFFFTYIHSQNCVSFTQFRFFFLFFNLFLGEFFLFGFISLTSPENNREKKSNKQKKLSLYK